eukprot:scaffold18003_cov79-Phaeocystis_antarctica.AAC.1
MGKTCADGGVTRYFVRAFPPGGGAEPGGGQGGPSRAADRTLRVPRRLRSGVAAEAAPGCACRKGYHWAGGGSAGEARVPCGLPAAPPQPARHVSARDARPRRGALQGALGRVCGLPRPAGLAGAVGLVLVRRRSPSVR